MKYFRIEYFHDMLTKSYIMYTLTCIMFTVVHGASNKSENSDIQTTQPELVHTKITNESPQDIITDSTTDDQEKNTILKQTEITKTLAADDDEQIHEEYITFESFCDCAEKKSKQNILQLNEKIDLHIHNNSLVLKYKYNPDKEVKDEMKSLIKQLLTTYIKNYYEVNVNAHFFIGKCNKFETNYKVDLKNIYLLEFYRSLYKLYDSKQNSVFQNDYTSDKCYTLYTCLTMQILLDELYKLLEADSKILVIDNTCKDVNDFELAYNVIIESESVIEYADGDNILIINFKHNDMTNKNNFMNMVYLYAIHQKTHIYAFDKLSLEVVDYGFLEFFRKHKYTNEAIFTGKKIYWYTYKRKFIEDIEMIKNRKLNPDNDVIFSNLAVHTTYNKLNDNSDDKFYIGIETGEQFLGAKNHYIHIQSHSTIIIFILKVRQEKSNSVFVNYNGIDYFKVHVKLEISINYYTEYTYLFFYYIKTENNKKSYVLPNDVALFEKDETLETYILHQNFAKKLYVSLLWILDMSFMQYNDFFNFDNFIHNCEHNLSYIKGQVSQIKEIAYINDNFCGIKWFESKLKALNDGVRIKYLTGNFSFQKLIFMDISKINNHFEYFNFNDVIETPLTEVDIQKVGSIVLYVEYPFEQDIQRYFIAFPIDDLLPLRHTYFAGNYKIKNTMTITINNYTYQSAFINSIVSFYIKNSASILNILRKELNNTKIWEDFLYYSIIHQLSKSNNRFPAQKNSTKLYANEWQSEVTNYFKFQNKDVERFDTDEADSIFTNFKNDVLNILKTELSHFQEEFMKELQANNKTYIMYQTADVYINKNISQEITNILNAYENELVIENETDTKVEIGLNDKSIVKDIAVSEDETNLHDGLVVKDEADLKNESK
ncbi:hypothetical protein COBT_000124 [Conglomerata obtusa]